MRGSGETALAVIAPASRSPRVTSLRTRLLIALSVTILAFWVVAFGIREIFAANDESLWDGSLRSIAGMILVSLPADMESGFDDPERLAQSARIAKAGDATNKDDLSFQILINHQAVVRSPSAPAAPLKPDFVNGFADERIGDDLWRVYDASDPTGNIHVQVGRSPQQRASKLFERLSWFLFATLLLLVLPGIGIWWVTRWSFAPIDALRRLIAMRKPFDLTPLPGSPLPVEVKPLVDSFNELLRQLDIAVQGERRFIADAAHELRTPLAVLAAQAQVALRAVDIEEKNRALAILATGVERSARLSEQMLDLARLDASLGAQRFVPVDLAELVVLVVRDFESVARGRQQVIALNVESAVIACDTDEIGILLRNLLDNALRYCGDGGRVAVSCRYGARDGAIGACLDIADNGPGVAEGERERIFDRFFRGSGTLAAGSGLGLSLVARIAASHCATIDLGAGVGGRGLGVRIWFPQIGRGGGY